MAHRVGECAAAYELERDPQPAAVLDQIVDLHDMGVAELCHHARLLAEAPGDVAATPEMKWQLLERDLALEHGVECVIDDAHAAAAELTEDLVAVRGADVSCGRIVGRDSGIRLARRSGVRLTGRGRL